jgi:hypothetical protein
MTIEIPEQEKDNVLVFLKSRGVKVFEHDKELSREEALAGLEQGLKESKLMSEGKLKGKTLSQVINGK